MKTKELLQEIFRYRRYLTEDEFFKLFEVYTVLIARHLKNMEQLRRKESEK